MVARAYTGSMYYFVALPSILTNTGTASSVLEIKSDVLSGTLLLSGKSTASGIVFNPNAPASIVFSGTIAPSTTTAIGQANLVAMMKNLKTAYTGSVVASQ